MPKRLLFLLFTLLSFAAQAQTPPATPTATPPPPPRAELRPGQRDTLGALTSLFHRRRRGGKVWVGIGAGGLLAVLRVAANPSSSSTNGVQTTSNANGGGVAVVAVLFVGIPAAIGISKLANYSERKEDELDRAYRSGRALPRAVVRQLTAEDFKK
jgi:hypothetical protein